MTRLNQFLCGWWTKHELDRRSMTCIWCYKPLKESK